MYSKKYKLEKIEEFHRHNPIYDNMEGALCYLAYFKKGERGLFLYQVLDLDWFDAFPHRVHTSIVKDVEYTDDTVIVTTMNTRFTFKLIKRSKDR